MYLRHIVLQDWKAYVNGRFEFSAPSSRRNVILIGAKRVSFQCASQECAQGRSHIHVGRISVR